MNLWLQIYGLPLGMRTRDNAVEYGEKASSVLKVDFNKAKKFWGMAFLRVLVLVDLVNSLMAGCCLQCPHKPDLWIQFRYKRISAWCQGYGRLDHIHRFCFYTHEEHESPPVVLKQLKAVSLDARRFSSSAQTQATGSYQSSPPQKPLGLSKLKAPIQPSRVVQSPGLIPQPSRAVMNQTVGVEENLTAGSLWGLAPGPVL